MEIIREEDMTLERLQRLFQANGFAVEHDEFAEGIEVLYPNAIRLLMWISIHKGIRHLAMRIILIPRDEREVFSHEGERVALLEAAAYLNQNADMFATLTPDNLEGVSLDHRIPFERGVLDETLLSAAQTIASNASYASEYIRMHMRRQSQRSGRP